MKVRITRPLNIGKQVYPLGSILDVEPDDARVLVKNKLAEYEPVIKEGNRAKPEKKSKGE